MKKVIITVAILFACLGCSPPEQEMASKGIHRIVSLAPAITETLYALGAGGQIVGVTTYCNYPPEALRLPKVGDFAKLDFEKIIHLNPDIVITTTDGSHKETIEKLKSFGISTLSVKSKSFNEVLESISLIGASTGKAANAEKLVARMKKGWAFKGEAAAKKPSIVLLYGINPLVAAGEGSLGDEMIRQAGCTNIFGKSDRSYATTDHETIISLAPDIIIQATMGSESNAQARDYWGKWSAIPAVANNRLYVLDSDLVTRPGPRIVEGFRLITNAAWGKEEKE